MNKRIEIVKWVCSACNKRQRTIVVGDKLICEFCGWYAEKVEGQWGPQKPPKKADRK
jgi:hypothetical protein